ncbi:PAS domain-containing protein [Flavobacterium sp.]|uniref:PAS domain-containing protein n=1 Tax=Flavobacterium sp. TaxID=239 RepID=UPI00286A008A|nr:PAS domain-containing protein [Flavobacterium sp.]
MLKEYDNAWAKYQEKLNILSLPLVSWGFSKEFYSEEIQYKNINQFWNTTTDYLKLSKSEKRQLVITDKNFKIIFASENISKMNGYQPQEMLGKSPTMFQGLKTSKRTVLSIRKAIDNLKPFKEVILNYKKNGETYWCEIEAKPMFNQNGEFINYIALERIAS